MSAARTGDRTGGGEALDQQPQLVVLGRQFALLQQHRPQHQPQGGGGGGQSVRVDLHTAIVRNRAILLLVATTGLRNKEVRSLELRDLRWREAEVVVRRTQSKRDRVGPLLQELGIRFDCNQAKNLNHPLIPAMQASR